MLLLYVALAALVAVIAGGIAALDATRRGRSWFVPTVGVGAAVLVVSLAVVAADGVLLSAYAALTGRPLVVVAPRELLGLTAAAVAVVALAVLSGYGVLSRLSRPA